MILGFDLEIVHLNDATYLILIGRNSSQITIYSHSFIFKYLGAPTAVGFGSGSCFHFLFGVN